MYPYYIVYIIVGPAPAPPPPPTPIESGGMLCSFPINWILSHVEKMIHPYLGYWLPLAIKTKLSGPFSGNLPETEEKIPPFPRKWEHPTCGPPLCMHSRGGGGGGEIVTMFYGLSHSFLLNDLLLICSENSSVLVERGNLNLMNWWIVMKYFNFRQDNALPPFSFKLLYSQLTGQELET